MQVAGQLVQQLAPHLKVGFQGLCWFRNVGSFLLGIVCAPQLMLVNGCWLLVFVSEG
jgi:hypothetical protein